MPAGTVTSSLAYGIPASHGHAAPLFSAHCHGSYNEGMKYSSPEQTSNTNPNSVQSKFSKQITINWTSALRTVSNCKQTVTANAMKSV